LKGGIRAGLSIQKAKGQTNEISEGIEAIAEDG
jgi:hypothetical protein